jgi:antitoxin VapB
VVWSHCGVDPPSKDEGMALNIKDPETEKLAAEVAAITGESKTRAVKVALQERKQWLAVRVVRRDRTEELRRFLVQEVWPRVPRRVLGKRITRQEREAILGYGPEGV